MAKREVEENLDFLQLSFDLVQIVGAVRSSCNAWQVASSDAACDIFRTVTQPKIKNRRGAKCCFNYVCSTLKLNDLTASIQRETRAPAEVIRW